MSLMKKKFKELKGTYISKQAIFTLLTAWGFPGSVS